MQLIQSVTKNSRSQRVARLLTAGALTAFAMPSLPLLAAPRKSARLDMMPAISRGLKIVDLRKGKGNLARLGWRVTVHYRGVLANGRQFDSSFDRRAPFQFTLGAGEVIKGWDQGVAGMRVGGRRKLIIPPALGYGASGAGTEILPNATLIFVIDLIGAQRH